MNDALVIIPTYDERDNLAMIVGRTLAAGAAVDVLVVDDGSPDGTGALADASPPASPAVHVLHRTEKEGLGAAYLAGFAWGLERGYDAIVEMDADGSHHPEDLPAHARPARRRTTSCSARAGCRAARSRTGRCAASCSAAAATGTPASRSASASATRPAASARSAPRRCAASTSTHVASRGYCFQVDLLWRALQAGLRVVEVPITFTERVHGVSKMSGSIVRESLTKVTLWGLRRRGRALVELVVRHRRLPSVRASSHRVGPVVRHAQAR